MSCGCATGHDCGCHGTGMHGYNRRPRTWRLGALAPSAAAAQVIGSDSGVNASSRTAIGSAASSLMLVDANGQPAYIPGPECAAASGVPSGAQTDLKLAQTASGLALTGVNVGLMAAGVALGPVTAGISIAVSAIVGLFSTLINHHAQAVAKEQTVLCSAVPAANNYLKIIVNAVSSGLATPQDAISALESLKGDFRSAVGSIYKDCNAACVMYMELEAICLVLESQFQDMIDSANAAAAAPPQPATVITAGGPNAAAPAVTAPPSSYASFYSGSSGAPGATATVAAPTNPSPTVAMPGQASAAPGATGDWLPVAALFVAGIFLLRSL